MSRRQTLLREGTAHHRLDLATTFAHNGDHAAQPGTANHVVQSLHRIDEKFAVNDIVSRGFEYKGSLDVLRNSADDHTVNVFEPSVRGKTDQFVLKFVKK